MSGAEQTERVAEIVEAALDLEQSAWPAYLERACGGDPALRAEAESLLGFHDRAAHFIEKPASPSDPAAFLANDDGDLKPGDRIDAYAIVSLLGEGGMGEVYLAQDIELGRAVALKLVRRGLGQPEMIQQFRREERILAALNHPHIARLYGAGVSPQGVPYFVMEYVEGEPLAKFCSHHQLDLSRRLELFRQLCSAVAYAHQHLVIHRDLKPGNIRVTAAGEPKLLDFGIARLLGDTADETVKQSTSLAGVMTPEYASPEQVRGEPMTTASDVYSLGVILYELLTGEKPYHLTSRKPTEIAHTIAAQNIAPPSASRTPDHRSLRGDLDSIILRAMQKDPAERYASAAEFSEDIRRHLGGLTVRARKGSWSYRSGKFVRRHKLAMAAATVVALTLLGGIVATLNQARRAERQRARAERRFQDVRQLANSLMFELHDAIENLPGSTPARALIVKKAITYLDSLAQEAHDDPSLQRELVSAYLRVGNVQGNPSNANLGDTAGALRSYTHAQEIAGQLLAANAADTAAQRSLGVIKEKMGDLQTSTGDIPGAVATTRESLAIFRSLAEAEPANAAAQLSLAISHIKMGDVLGNPNLPNSGDLAGAMENYRASLALLRQLAQADSDDLKTRRFLGIILERIGTILETQGDQRGAHESYGESQRIREDLATQEPENTSAIRDAAIAHEKMANVLTTEGDLAGALSSRKKSLAIFQRLLAVDPKNVQSQLSLAISCVHLAGLTGGPETPNLGQREEALQSYRRALELLIPLADEDPTDTKVRDLLTEARQKLETLEAPLIDHPSSDGDATRKE